MYTHHQQENVPFSPSEENKKFAVADESLNRQMAALFWGALPPPPRVRFFCALLLLHAGAMLKARLR